MTTSITYNQAQLLLARVKAATKVAMRKTDCPSPALLLVHGQACAAIKGASQGRVTEAGVEAAVAAWEAEVEKM